MSRAILVLAPYPPFPPRGGGALRIFHLVEWLVRQGEQVTLLSFAPSLAAISALAPLRQQLEVVTVIGPPPRSTRRRLRDLVQSDLPDMAHRNASVAFTAGLGALLRRRRFDLLIAMSIEMAQYGPLARNAGFPGHLILDQFNAEYLLQQRAATNDLQRWWRPKALLGGLYSSVQWRRLARYEAQMLATYDACCVVSDEDRHALALLAPEARFALVPNGVASAEFVPQPAIARQPDDLIFTGTLDYRPNVDALAWFVREVLPLIRARRPAARLMIVGRKAGPPIEALADDGVVLVGEVADVRPAIAAAAVYVVPMRIGGGVRLKLLEALSMAAPIVSTPMGAEGINGLVDGEHLRLAADATSFALAVEQLLDDPATGARMGAAGRELVAATYDWQAIGPRLSALLDDLGPAADHIREPSGQRSE